MDGTTERSQSPSPESAAPEETLWRESFLRPMAGGGWSWCDGQYEPRVRGRRDGAAEPVYRAVGGSGRAFVEVPFATAENDADLRWVAQAREAHRYSVDVADRVVLVPTDAWEEWVRKRLSAVAWDAAHEHAILQRAWDLGWRPPPGYVSPQGWKVPH